jgi:hypothetical protein
MDFFPRDQLLNLAANSTIAFAQLLVNVRHRSTSRRLCRPTIRGGSGAEALRSARTLEKAGRGGLPATFKRQLWVGPGSDKPCSGCGEMISRTEREFEVFADTLTFLFHGECYKAWVSMLPLEHKP